MGLPDRQIDQRRSHRQHDVDVPDQVVSSFDTSSPEIHLQNAYVERLNQTVRNE